MDPIGSKILEVGGPAGNNGAHGEDKKMGKISNDKNKDLSICCFLVVYSGSSLDAYVFGRNQRKYIDLELDH